jgi:hypothetical protein
VPPDWLNQLLRVIYVPRDGPKLRKMAAVAERIDARNETLSDAVRTLSSKVKLP